MKVTSFMIVFIIFWVEMFRQKKEDEQAVVGQQFRVSLYRCIAVEREIDSDRSRKKLISMGWRKTAREREKIDVYKDEERRLQACRS